MESKEAVKHKERAHMLSRAQVYADMNSTCAKVKVGSVIITDTYAIIYGCNRGIERDCVVEGCRRIAVYGEDSKSHRLPSDCVAVHSEVDAICQAAKLGIRLKDSVIYVTRYPCEACARAIVKSGIRKVVYGRKESISEMSAQTFRTGNVEVIHLDDWEYADNNS